MNEVKKIKFSLSIPSKAKRGSKGAAMLILNLETVDVGGD
jgi:hypothetical protein